MTIAESMKILKEAVKLALSNELTVTAGIATVFGCSIEGWVPPQKVDEIAEQFLDMEVQELSLADTVGMANPSQVSEMVRHYMDRLRGTNVGLRLHFHNTRGMGLANVLTALLEGATVFDASICGLGGCPYAPGATGNIPTADTAHMVESMGLNTGIDLPKLVECANTVRGLLNREVPGQVMKAGIVPWVK